MNPAQYLFSSQSRPSFADAFVAIAAAGIIFAILKLILSMGRASNKKRKLPPAVPGLPILGNLLQLTDMKPHRSFTAWAAKYGPIFRVKIGFLNQIVISSSELAKEAMVTKYESISKRDLGTALQILTCEKTMVAMSDYGDEHRLLKKIMVSNLLGQIPQKENRQNRSSELQKVMESLHAELKGFPGSTGEINVRQYLKEALFPFVLKQTFGKEIEELNVPGMGLLSKWEIYNILVLEAMRGAVLVDWRDFFPPLKRFFANKVEAEARRIEACRSKVIKALIEEQKKHLPYKSKADYGYADHLLANFKNLNETQLRMIVWEAVIESSDTTLVTAEWALYELAMRPSKQERLYNEIKEIVGDRSVTEDDIPNLPYLTAVIKETLRKYSPVPLLPPRYVERDVQIGGYDIPAGYNVLINLYGINHDKDTWPNPDEWNPERLLGDEKLDLGITDFRIMPFGAGKRICAGIAQAMSLVHMHVARFVQNFKWALPESEENVNEQATFFLTTHKLHPLKAIATPRSKFF